MRISTSGLLLTYIQKVASVPQNVPRSLSPFGLARLAKPLRVSAFCLLRNLKEAPFSCEVSRLTRRGLARRANPKGLSDLGRSEGLRQSESNRTLGITPLCLVDGIDLVTVNLMTKTAVDDVHELLDLCYSTLKVIKLKWFS